MKHKALFGALLILANQVSIAADDSAAKPAPPKFIGQCSIGKSVAIANKRCANGWPKNKYPQWESGDNSIATTVLAQPMRIKGAGPLKITDVDPTMRMVQVDSEDGKLWVTADALECDSKNVSNYVLPVVPAPSPGLLDADCPKPGQLPLDPEQTNALWKRSSLSIRAGIMKKADQYVKATRQNVIADNKALAAAFHSKETLKDEKARFAALVSAKDKLIRLRARAQKLYGSNCDAPPSGAKLFEISVERGERLCRTLRDAAALAERNIDEKNMKKTLALMDYDIDDLLLGHQPDNQQLSVRMILAYALELDSRHKQQGKSSLFNQLKFARMSPDFMSLEIGLGKKTEPELLELHNGYLFGATGKPGEPIECAGFALNYILGMQRKADPDAGKGSIPSVHDFETIHRYLAKESFETGYFADYINCFKVVDLRADQHPMAGDFVSTHGHIAIVDKYDPDTREVTTVESASGDLGTIGLYRRPLFEPACVGDKPYVSNDWKTRPLRADIRVLRFDPRPGCKVHPNSL